MKCENEIRVYAKTMKKGKEATKRKIFGPVLDLCVSSLRRGHANLLCIIQFYRMSPKGQQ
ncbi:hypothetical protein Hanom_Chr15g01339871 [Helianthus anomalus]